MPTCASLDRLRRLLERQLGDDEREELERHVESCAACQQALESLTRDATLDARLHGGSKSAEGSGAGAAAALPARFALLAQPATGGRPEMPGYEILGELGRGGMGVVYKARHVLLKRVVALKVILAGPHAGAADLARFKAEAEVVARLQHPNIVQVFEVGEHEGWPYLALEFVEGGTLADQLGGTPLPPRRAAELTAVLARAMDYAHRRGVVHRDLKPGNVLLTPDGTPKVGDFGVAKQLDAEASASRTDTLLGTPSYMAPEQTTGRNGAIGPLVDVYALGAVLYELLTGRPPFKAATPLETVQQVAWEDPVPPARLQPRLPPDLETLCLKCLHKEPRQRYASAQDLADDLQRFLDGKPVRARRTGPLGLGWRWCRRSPALAAVSGLAVAALIATTLVSVFFAFAETDAADRLRAEQEQTREALEDAKAQRRLAEERGRLAEERRLRAEEGRAYLAFDRALTLCNGEEPDRGALWLAHSLALAERAKAVALQRHIRTALGAWQGELHPLQAWLAADEARGLACAFDVRTAMTVYPDDTVRLWDVGTGRPLGRPFRHPGLSLASADAPRRVVLTNGADNKPRLWDAVTGRQLGGLLRTEDGPLTMALFTPDGKTVVTASARGKLECWEVASGRCLGKPIPCVPRSRVALSPEGGSVVANGPDGTACLWEVPTGRRLVALDGFRGPLRAAAFSPDGKLLLTGGTGAAQLWRVESGQPLHAPLLALTPRGLVTTAAFSPDGRTVATAGTDGNARLWSVASGKPLGRPVRHLYSILTVAFSPDGQLLLTGSGDNTARLWDVNTCLPVGSPLRHRDWVKFAAFAPDGRTVLTGSADRSARLWQVAPPRSPEVLLLPNQQPVLALGFGPGSRPLVAGGGRAARSWEEGRAKLMSVSLPWPVPTALALSPDGRTFLAGYADGTARLLEASSGKPFGPTLRHEGADSVIHAVAFRPDGRAVATGSEDRTARVWDATTGAPLAAVMRHPGPVRALAFRRDGLSLATGCEDRAARLWDTSTGKSLAAPLRQDGPVVAIAFSPDGRTVLTGSADKTARLWDAATGRPRGAPLGHKGGVHAVTFSPDGNCVLTGSADWTARLWEAATGRPLSPSFWHPNPVHAVAFSPDGGSFLTGCADGTVRRRLMPAPLEGRPEDIQLRVEAATGMELDASQAVRMLDADGWSQRRQRLGERAGAAR